MEGSCLRAHLLSARTGARTNLRKVTCLSISGGVFIDGARLEVRSHSDQSLAVSSKLRGTVLWRKPFEKGLLEWQLRWKLAIVPLEFRYTP